MSLRTRLTFLCGLVTRSGMHTTFRFSIARSLGCAETAVDVVVDRADVLHKCVHARRADEVITLQLQLLGERLCFWSRRRYLGERPRWALSVDLVGLRQLGEARRSGLHRTCVVDGRLDLGAVSDDRRVFDQLADIPRSHLCDLGDVEAMKRFRFPNTISQLRPAWNTPRVRASNRADSS